MSLETNNVNPSLCQLVRKIRKHYFQPDSQEEQNWFARGMTEPYVDYRERRRLELLEQIDTSKNLPIWSRANIERVHTPLGDFASSSSLSNLTAYSDTSHIVVAKEINELLVSEASRIAKFIHTVLASDDLFGLQDFEPKYNRDFCYRFDELCKLGMNRDEAMEQAKRDIGTSNPDEFITFATSDGYEFDYNWGGHGHSFYRAKSSKQDGSGFDIVSEVSSDLDENDYISHSHEIMGQEPKQKSMVRTVIENVFGFFQISSVGGMGLTTQGPTPRTVEWRLMEQRNILTTQSGHYDSRRYDDRGEIKMQKTYIISNPEDDEYRRVQREVDNFFFI